MGEVVKRAIDAGITLPTNEVIINSQSDFPAAAGGVIPLANNTVYKIGVTALVLTAPLDFSNASALIVIEGFSLIIYMGTGALYRGSFSGAIQIQDVGITAAFPGATVFDLTGTGIIPLNLFLYRFIGVSNFASFGHITNVASVVDLFNIQFTGAGGTGLKISSSNELTITGFRAQNSSTSNSPLLSIDGNYRSIQINGSTPGTLSGESFLQISSDISITDKFTVSSTAYNQIAGAEFLATAKTGTNTVYADNGSGGTTVTSAAHGMTIEQAITVAGSTSYNGTHVLSDITTNTYDIDVAFVADDAAGTFTTGDSNDFLDNNCFQFSSNGDQKDSNEIGHMDLNTLLTISIAVAGTPVAVTGVAGNWDSEQERRFIVNFPGDPAGTMRYVGTKTEEFWLKQKVTFEPNSGGAILMSGFITVDSGSGPISIANTQAESESARATSVYPQGTLELSPNDVIGTSVANEDSTVNIDVLAVDSNAFSL